jgi:hypothetical protein
MGSRSGLEETGKAPDEKSKRFYSQVTQGEKNQPPLRDNIRDGLTHSSVL